MRTSLIAATAALSILTMAPAARATLPVIDPADIAQSITNTTNEIVQMKAQLAQLQATYTMFTNPSQILSMLPSLNTGYLQNPMPAANTIAGQVVGTGGMNGYAQTFYGLNNSYTPTGNDAQANYLNQNSQAMANIEGIAARNLGSIESRLSDLDEMETTLQSATDIKQVEAVNGRLAIENNAIQAQTAQAENLQALTTAQIEAEHIQQQATVRQNAEAMQAAFPNAMQ